MIRMIQTSAVAAFSLEDLEIERCFTDCTSFSVYEGVLVVWDQDLDNRVITLINQLHDQEHFNLLAIHEHAGSVHLLWEDHVPENYTCEAAIQVENDLWPVVFSKAVRSR